MLLRYSEQSNRASRKEKITAIICSVLLGGAVFAFFCSALSLSWSPKQLFAGDPIRGMLSVCNSIADRLGETDYIILRRFAGGFAEDGSPAAQGMFLTMLLIVTILLCWLILRSRNSLLLLIPVLPAAALMLFTEAAPGPWAGLAFAFALCCALATMARGGENLWVTVLPLTIAILVLGAGIAMDQNSGFAAAGWHAKAVERAEEAAEKRYGKNPLTNGRLDELDGRALVDARGSMEDAAKQLSEGKKSETALEVTMDDPGATYLRGFVGESYGNSRWSELGNDVYYRQRDQLYWLNNKGFDGLSQLSEAEAVAAEGADDEQEHKTGRIAVRVKEADRCRIYIPYETVGTDGKLPDGMQSYAGGFLKTDKLFGTGSYEWTGMSALTDKWTDLAGRLYSAARTDELNTYFENESHYNVWCYENYTHIPDDMIGLLEAAVGDPGDLSKDHADYKETITLIRDYLDSSFIYTEDFDEKDAGEDAGKDAIEQFLLTGKGCDAHYASLATLLFRWFGIPARYVEGYLVTPADAEGAKATSPMKIGASNCHAWTEIYIDGLGWVPLEVTTAYRDIMPEADMDKGLEAVAYENRPKNQDSPTEEDMIIDSQSPGYGRIILKVLLAALALLILIILAWIASRLIRGYLKKKKRQKAFADPDPRKGICAMYGYMLKEGLPRRTLATEIGDLAAFSNNEVEEVHRAQMRMEIEWSENEKRALDKNDRRTVSDRVFDLWSSLRRK